MNRRDVPLPPLLAGQDEVFPEPWQAQAFAIVIALHQNGLFSWREWTDSLSVELKTSGAAENGSGYYRCWLSTLERLLANKGVAARDEIDSLTAAWQRAAHATPHGKPILLENDPQIGRQ
ncbi:nitrile hydratase accessory protein [Rhodoligotrophos defluvii]|uniref:nitrile hydratase accessory protein n=1 Tax=Rhodoligotrophos defluvii TaxID=2561934 RepID=UPI001EF127B6|nr:nitrile hydratase accessory protein [Rhodoligotrophos defluvii]